MLNVVVLIGRVATDPELKYTPSGIAVTSFRIAVNRGFKKEGAEQETDFIDVVAWRKTAEFVSSYLNKGRLVAVQGRLQIRTWVTDDGGKRSKAEVVADQVRGLDKPKSADGGSTGGYTPEPEDDFDPFAED